MIKEHCNLELTACTPPWKANSCCS